MSNGKSSRVPSIVITKAPLVVNSEQHRDGQSRTSPTGVDGRESDTGNKLFLKLTVEELFRILQNPKSLSEDVNNANATIDALYPNVRGLPQQFRY